jgi:hypothetical protein
MPCRKQWSKLNVAQQVWLADSSTPLLPQRQDPKMISKQQDPQEEAAKTGSRNQKQPLRKTELSEEEPIATPARVGGWPSR